MSYSLAEIKGFVLSLKPAYRPDIDGLRAVAVLGVMLYHYGATWLPGGFTGVDVFFVISGYLITSILRREIEAGEFSIFKFYDRRIRRIFPALLVVLAATIVAGWFLLMPGDYAELGQSAAYAAFGLGNLFFFWNTGYFDQASDLQPLLHTWSLGVEEQFYLVWPLALLVLFWLLRTPKNVAITIALLITVGFAFAIYEANIDPKSAFYLPHPRAWELGTGAILAFAPTMKRRALSEVARTIGVLLIVYSFLSVTAAEPFPGYNAAFACLGAALLIWPAESPTLAGRILSIKPLVAIGLVSYSLYLWHWPVIVLFRHYNNSDMPDVFFSILLALLSFILAYFTWKYIETPFRLHTQRQWRIGYIVRLTVLIAVAGGSISFASGVPDRVSPQVFSLRSLSEMWKWDCPHYAKVADVNYCVFGAPWEEADEKIFIWGDSNAEHLVPIINASLPDPAPSVLMYRTCPAHYGGDLLIVGANAKAYNEKCQHHYRDALDFISKESKISTVILGAYWEQHVTTLQFRGQVPSDYNEGVRIIGQGLLSLLESLQKITDLKVIVVGGFPAYFQNGDPVSCAVSQVSGLTRSSCNILPNLLMRGRQKAINETLSIVSSEFDNVEYLDGHAPFCKGDDCITSINGEFLYRDSAHLRRNLPEDVLVELGLRYGFFDAFRENRTRVRR